MTLFTVDYFYEPRGAASFSWCTMNLLTTFEGYWVSTPLKMCIVPRWKTSEINFRIRTSLKITSHRACGNNLSPWYNLTIEQDPRERLPFHCAVVPPVLPECSLPSCSLEHSIMQDREYLWPHSIGIHHAGKTQFVMKSICYLRSAWHNVKIEIVWKIVLLNISNTRWDNF
jgi:hypothetical protein